MRSPRTLRAAILCASACLVVAGGARADDRTTETSPNFGRRSHLIVTAENVAGGASESLSDSTSGEATSLNSNGLFAGYTGPRFGVHAAFGPSLTAGAGIGVWSAHDTTSHPQTTSSSVVRFAPRFGWIPALGPFLSLWLRAGPTLVKIDSGATLTFWDFSFDALAAWTPFQHFGVLVGPQFDVAVSGKSSASSSPRYQSSAFFVGLFVDL